MRVIYPTDSIRKVESIFLAGTIEMGNSIDWQAQVIKELENEEVIIYNPRRKDWDSSWQQEESNPVFNRQVNWELLCLQKADLIVLYLDPDSKSPITLLELGLFLQKKMIVCCPTGFYRKGNVDIICTNYGLPRAKDLEELIWLTKSQLSQEL